MGFTIGSGGYRESRSIQRLHLCFEQASAAPGGIWRENGRRKNTARIAGSPVQMECMFHSGIEYGFDGAEAIVGEVVRFHADSTSRSRFLFQVPLAGGSSNMPRSALQASRTP